ncbi:MAG: acyltransferase [Mycobacterium sp.]|nr:acyltransferase [Mycobacterium sp.]
MTGPADGDQGGLEQVAAADRVPALTGLRAVAALSVVGTHAAFGTGALNRSYPGMMLGRLDIGVAIFFVLSGLLLFGPWVRAAAAGTAGPSVRRYGRNRLRRIMPAYLVTVVAAYLLYHLRPIEPNPGHTWTGLFRNLTLTQIYGDYFSGYQHQGLTQMWSLAVEVAFYLLLPVLAWVLVTVVCRGRWRPRVLLAGLAAVAAVSPLWLVVLDTTDWLPAGARLWLPHYLVWFGGGMMLAVLQSLGVRCRWRTALAAAVVGYLVVSTPLAGSMSGGGPDLGADLARTLLYAVIATLVVAPVALPGPAAGPPTRQDPYTRLLSCRPMVRLGEISYEIFLLHVIVMEVALSVVLGWPLFTGSAAVLFAVTVALTAPPAWLLHRATRPPGTSRPGNT